MKTYNTIHGDTWDSIAYRQMGSCLYTDLLISANARHSSVLIFEAGIMLTIPDAPEKREDDLPPWKRKGKSA